MTNIVKNEVDFAEESFYDHSLLHTEYMQRYRKEYYIYRKTGFTLNSYRNYLSILNYLNEINQYDKSHAAKFVKRIKTQQKMWNDCEAVVSEVIVRQFKSEAQHLEILA